MNWISCSERFPPINQEVMTTTGHFKSEQILARKSTLGGDMWFAGSMYIYYSPTHWRKLLPQEIK